MRLLIKIIFYLSFLFTLFPYIIFAYENIGYGKKLNPKELLISFTKEFLSYIYLFSTWIFGFFKIENYIPRRTGIKTPVFIIPGYFLNRSSVFFLFYFLRNRGFENIFIIVPTPFTDSVENLSYKSAKMIDEKLENILADSKEIFIIGHSLGGIIAKYITENQDKFDFEVKKCVTICSPHSGTRLAHFGIGKSAKDITPQSNIIHSLKYVKEPSKYLCISAKYDQLTIPYESSFIDGAEKKEYLAFGHFSLLFSSDLADTIHEFFQRTEKVSYQETYEEKKLVQEGA